MKTIKIKFVDFWPGFDATNNQFLDMLKKNYQVLLNDNPDYIIYSVFGFEHLKYDCIRIFFTGENQVPDFNICDYAMGFHYITFDDRYIRFPLYLLNFKKDFEMALLKHIYTKEEIIKKNGFCNFVYSNANAHSNRELFYNLLNSYKKVDSGGRYLNNIGHHVDNKFEFQSNYKFSIAFENSPALGYTTEKIVQAFAAKTIPIYWGNSLIGREFNPKAFINCHDYEDFGEVVEKVKEVDQNHEMFIGMLSEPIFNKPTNIDTINTYGPIEKFLSNIFDQDINSAFRRDRFYWGKIYHEGLAFNARMHEIFAMFKIPLVIKKLIKKVFFTAKYHD